MRWALGDGRTERSRMARIGGMDWRARASMLSCVLLLYGIGIGGCGHKTPVRPPSLIAPEPIGDLALNVQDQGVRLSWSRPQRYMDGSQMEDLGGFVVLRAARSEDVIQPFARIALIPVADHDRFQQAKKFDYTDTPLSTGTFYRYRVVAVTLDGYLSARSNTVELQW